MRSSFRWMAFLVCLALAAAWTLPARAGFTTIPPNPNEPSIAAIINHLYSNDGGAFHAVGRGYANGEVTVLRVPDTPKTAPVEISQTGLDGATDQLWQNGVFSARAVGHFTQNRLAFGYLDGANGNDFHQLLSVGGGKRYVNIAAPEVSMLDETWRWAIKGPKTVKSSLQSDNVNKVDRLVTYEVLNYKDEGTPRWLLFFEDGWARDFNDLVVEIRVRPQAPPPTVPEPATMLVWLGLAGTAIIWRRRR